MSIAMAADDASLASIWPRTPQQLLPDLHCFQSVEELKQKIAAVTAELGATKEEVCQKQHNIASLVEQVLRTAQECDLLLATEMQASPTPTSQPCPWWPSILSISADLNRSMDTAVAPHVPSFGAPLMSSSQVAVDPAPMIKPFVVPRSAVDIARSMAAAALEVPTFATLVPNDKSKMAALELLAARRPLPQQGRLVQAVMEAGPLLQHLLVAGSLPRWRNPPPVQALADPMISAPSGSGATMGLSWSSAPSGSGAPMGLPW
ncbi:unnamed protein product [Alopecurus aequalis]